MVVLVLFYLLTPPWARVSLGELDVDYMVTKFSGNMDEH